jgi:hypothetical protein
MTDVLQEAGRYEEFEELVVEETGNNQLWLGDCEYLDTVEEDTEKIELQNRVALLEQRLAQPVSQMRFIQAVEGALTLRTVTAEMDALRAENAQLKRRVQQLEAEAKPEGASSSSGR